MTRNSESSYEEETLSDSSRERNAQPRRPHKGGKIIREKPISMIELLSCPLATTCFRYQSFFEFCDMVERVTYHHELARHFVINMENNVVHIPRINFTLSPAIIAEATRIPDVGEKWNKGRISARSIMNHILRPNIMANLAGCFLSSSWRTGMFHL